MEKTSCDRRVFLNTYINTAEYLIFDGTIGSLHTDFYVDKKVVKKKNNCKLLSDIYI
jgi:hypothetical protein